MQYLSIYSSAGERITSLATGIHAETIEELKQLAKKEYPSHVHVVQTESEHNEAVSNNLLYIDGKYSSYPEPTKEERLTQERQVLDSQYTKNKLELGRQYLDALVHDDTEMLQEIKAELQSLDAAYDEATGALTATGGNKNA